MTAPLWLRECGCSSMVIWTVVISTPDETRAARVCCMRFLSRLCVAFHTHVCMDISSYFDQQWQQQADRPAEAYPHCCHRQDSRRLQQRTHPHTTEMHTLCLSLQVCVPLNTDTTLTPFCACCVDKRMWMFTHTLPPCVLCHLNGSAREEKQQSSMPQTQWIFECKLWQRKQEAVAVCQPWIAVWCFVLFMHVQILPLWTWRDGKT